MHNTVTVEKLTRRQAAVVREASRLFRSGEPLNISAVKRRWPSLLHEAYRSTPFLGWKQTLDIAGIPYGAVSVELTDLAECRLCGWQALNLSMHLMKTHGCLPEEYLIDYPDSDILSETMRAYLFGRRRREVKGMPPHWEPLWTEEYVLDRLMERYKRKLSMHHHAIHNHDANLCGHAKKRFGTYDHALERLGLNPELIRRVCVPFHTTESICAAITERRKQGKRLNLHSVKVGASRDSKLYKGALRLFGSWRKAIEATGMDYDTIRQLPIYSEPVDVIEEVQHRQKEGRTLKYSGIERGPEADKTLLRAACRHFGSWGEALAQADRLLPVCSPDAPSGGF
jgi:hypothetical protein